MMDRDPDPAGPAAGPVRAHPGIEPSADERAGIAAARDAQRLQAELAEAVEGEGGGLSADRASPALRPRKSRARPHLVPPAGGERRGRAASPLLGAADLQLARFGTSLASVRRRQADSLLAAAEARLAAMTRAGVLAHLWLDQWSEDSRATFDALDDLAQAQSLGAAQAVLRRHLAERMEGMSRRAGAWSDALIDLTRGR